MKRFLAWAWYWIGHFFSRVPFCYRFYNYAMCRSFELDYGRWNVWEEPE